MAFVTLFSKNFNRCLAFSVCLVALSPMTHGFDGQGFSGTQALQAFAKQFGVYNTKKGKYELQTYWLALYSSFKWIGYAIGVLVGSSLSARYGRKVGILALSAWSMIATTVLVTSYSRWQILVGRILFTASSGMQLVTISVYQAEVVPSQVRGLVVSTYHLSQLVGGLIMNLILLGTATIHDNRSWRIPFGLFYVVPALIICGLFWLPESPRWLLVKERQAAAHHSLTLLREGKRSAEEIDEELTSIEVALQEEPEQGRFVELWQRKSIRRTLIAVGTNFFQELSGQQITGRFGALIIKDIGTIDPFIITVILAVVGIVTVFGVMGSTDRVGRRPFLLVSISVMCLAEIALGALGTYNYTDRPALGSAAIFCLVLLSFAFDLGYGPLTNVIMTEVVSLRLRDMTVRTAGMTRVVCDFVVGFTLPYEINSIGLKLGFIYAGLCFAGFWFTFLCVPECKGKSLELIEHMFEVGVPSRKFRSWKDDVPNLTEETVIVEDKAAEDAEKNSEAMSNA